MKQNLYDNPDFFAGYSSLREGNTGLNKVLEQPAMRSLLPNVQGMHILDLGCGTGQLCRELIANGASSVIGIDISERMLALAQMTNDEHITYINSAIEDFVVDAGSFDLIVSSLAFHYIKDYYKVISKIANWLSPNGHLIFSIEHPVCTASQGIHPGWSLDATGKKECWMLDHYQEEGLRQSHWFIDGVIKYHRTTSTIINTLINAGFTICRILEPCATELAESKRPKLIDERRRPPFLFVKAQKEA